MIRFLVKRALLGLVVLWLISLVTFGLFFVVPSDPAALLAGELATPEQVDAVRRTHGLDQTPLVQYGRWLSDVARGDLGHSYYSGQSVWALLASRAPVSVSVALGGGILGLGLGVLLGTLSAVRPGSWIDRLTTTFALVLASTPAFLLALVALYLLFFRLHQAGFGVLPASGYTPLLRDPVGWSHHLVLPWLTVALTTAPETARLSRAALLDVLQAGYIRVARAKGLGPWTVTVRHGLRNALIPVVTNFGVELAALLGGLVIVETVFGLPGLGQLAVISVTAHDLPTVIGITLLAATFVVVANTAVDILYGLLDPRIRR